MSKGSTQKVSRLLVAAREEGMVAWDWIVDETRAPECVASWDNPSSIIGAAVSQYRKDYWADQPNRVEVWSEKGTVRGTLAPVLRDYGVTFRVQHGYGSATAIHDAAQDSVANDKPLTVLYTGDFDPSGLHMSAADLPERVARYGGRVAIKRVALTADDVAPGTAIPGFDAASKIKDPRYQWFRRRYGTRCWELDALSPVTLRARVAAAIADLLDVGKWNRAVQVERADRESMKDFLDTWQRTISIPVSKCPEGAP
ncbi:MAG: hypothetical protein M0P72_01955 [Metallibacterium scheffleri]|jgi:hypothetical protein|uniref:hypothetical protein n=1 Tax=Metallibacterium scheffleri TaxID=993689 RepID=UPI0026F213C8|nr:hypothetical protein [Metallibacterium scheffleri]MCK9365899.1 hypothetical protein [Metallibacterium scheffleri]